jgi:hypothetical protein
MSDDLDLATELWTAVFKSGYEWYVRDEIETIAAQCGLGVLTVQALNEADYRISNDMKVGGRWMPPDVYQQLDIKKYAPKWAQEILSASLRFPWGKVVYPVAEPANHTTACVGQARKGKWCVRYVNRIFYSDMPG